MPIHFSTKRRFINRFNPLKWVFLIFLFFILIRIYPNCAPKALHRKSLTSQIQKPQENSLVKLAPVETDAFPVVRMQMFLHDSTGTPVINLAQPYCDNCSFWHPGIESHPIYGTKKISTFRVIENHPIIPGADSTQAKPISHYTILVIDISASMEGRPLNQAKKAALNFITRTDAKIALLTFETTVTPITNFTTNETELRKHILNLKSGGGTRLYNALYESITMLKQVDGYRSIVILTDGSTGGDAYTLDEIIEYARDMNSDNGVEGIRIYPIGYEFPGADLKRLADETRGFFYHATNRRTLQTIFRSISDSLKSHFWYDIHFRTPFPRKDGTQRQFSFTFRDSIFNVTYPSPLSQTDFELLGTVFDKETQKPVPKAKIMVRRTNFNEIHSTVSDTNGQFNLTAPRYFGEYTFLVEGPPGYFMTVQDSFMDLRGQYYVRKNFYLPRLSRDAKIRLWTIYFEKDDYFIQKNSISFLDLLVNYFLLRPQIQFEISGHTDDQGTKDHNQWLSEKRAESVRRYFISKGISASKMRAVGFGESNPIAANTNPENRRLNRRVEIRLLKID